MLPAISFTYFALFTLIFFAVLELCLILSSRYVTVSLTVNLVLIRVALDRSHDVTRLFALISFALLRFCLELSSRYVTVSLLPKHV